MNARQVSGGGRAVEVSAARLPGWFGRFAERHGELVETTAGAVELLVRAGDGATATATVPYPPLHEAADSAGEGPAAPLVGHLLVPRRIGVILVRLGGYSIGVVATGPGKRPGEGAAEVLVSTTGSRYVHGRAAAGGTSQRRFARRREGQARRALAATREQVERVLLPRCDELDAVVLGGDRRALAELRASAALGPVFALAQRRVLDVPDPRRAVLDAVADRLLCCEIVVREN